METEELEKQKDGEGLSIEGFKDLVIQDDEPVSDTNPNEHSNKDEIPEGCETPFVHEYNKTVKLVIPEDETNNQSEPAENEEMKGIDLSYTVLSDKAGFLHKKSSYFFIGWQKRYP